MADGGQAYSVDPKTGMPMLQMPGGQSLPLPLSQQQMAQAGAQLAPPVQNMVAGPGGGPTDLGAPDASIRMAAGDGQGPRLSPGDLARLQTPQPTDRSHASAPSRADSMLGTGGAAAPQGLKLAEPKEERAPASQTEPSLDPMIAKVMAYRPGGGGPSGLQVGSEERKFQQLGKVDPTLATEIKANRDDLDASEWQQASQHAQRQDDVIAARYAEIQSRNAEIEADRQRRQAVDSKLQQLELVRTQREEAASSLKAPEMADYWRDKSMGAKMATGIALILGGALQGLRGGSNPGMDALNANIERWVANEKENYERAKGSAADANNQYKEALAVYGSPEQAEADLRLRAYAVRDAQIENSAQKIGTQDALANAQLALKAGKLQRQQLAAQAQQAAGPEITQKLAMHYAGAGGGNDPLAMLKRGAAATEAVDQITHRPKAGAADTEVRFPDGSSAYDRNAENAVKTQAKVQANDEVINTINDLKRLTADASSRAPGSAERAQAEVKAKALVFQLHDAMGVSGFRGPVVDMVHSMTEDPQNLFRSPATISRLDAIAQQATQNNHYTKKYLNAKPGVGGGSAAASAAPSEEDVEP